MFKETTERMEADFEMLTGEKPKAGQKITIKAIAAFEIIFVKIMVKLLMFQTVRRYIKEKAI
jgi:hypothetical protein